MTLMLNILGVFVVLVYFLALLFIDRSQRLAFEAELPDTRFLINQARASNYQVVQLFLYLVLPLVTAIQINSASGLTVNSVIQVVMTATTWMVTLNVFGKSRKSKEKRQEDILKQERIEIASEYVPKSYKQAVLKANILRIIFALLVFAYLVAVY